MAKSNVPYLYDKPVTITNISANGKANIIDNYSKTYDYIIQKGKVYSSKKGTTLWNDISDNNVARKNLYSFIKDKYNYKGYSDEEKSIGDNIVSNKFDYKKYIESTATVDSIKNKSTIIEPVKSTTFNPINLKTPITSNISDRNTTSTVIPKYKTLPKDSNKNIDIIKSVENSTDKVFKYYNIVKNGISRYLDKQDENIKDPVSNLKISNISTDSKYGIVPGYVTGDTIPRKDVKNGYYLPESIDMNSISLGVRNRGNYNTINTEAGIATAFSNFIPRKSIKDKTGSYIGVDKNGKFKAGDISEFSDDDLVSKTFSNRVKDFKTDAGKVLLEKRNAGNPNHYVPTVTTIQNGKEVEGSLNLLTRKNSKDSSTFGNITGGRTILRAGNETRLVSGSIDNIYKEFNDIKKRNKSEYVDVYTLDNGSYNLGIRTKNKTLSKADLIKYDAQNTGGGNFLYIKDKNLSEFKSDTTLTPNVRTKLDESFKKGHPLVNENKGVLLHHTAYEEDDLTNVTKNFNTPGNNSAHVIIDYKGNRRVFAKPDKVTFHAGESVWNGRDNVNDFMIGIEFQGNTNKKPLTTEQINSAVEYLKPIIRDNNISLENITTHAKVRNLYNQYSNKKALVKNDINDNDYNNVINALKNTVYYEKSDTMNINKKAYGGRIHHAYGSKINPTWEGGDYATAGLSTGAGVLSGMAAGSVLGLPGAVVGGTIGLISGLLGSSAKAKQRAALKEQNRQQTIANMDQRTQSDAMESSNFNANPRSTSFYMAGGKMFANGGTMQGMAPLSHDTTLAVGPKHEQGGVSAGPNDEVEGGETMKQQGNETLVFSDRLTVPGTKVTFADASKPIMMFKGQLEKRFASNEKSIDIQRKVIDTPTNNGLKVGTAKRRAMIGSQNSEKILAQIGMLDSQLNEMFKVQEEINGNTEQDTEHAYGGKIKHWNGGDVPIQNTLDHFLFNAPDYVSPGEGYIPPKNTPKVARTTLSKMTTPSYNPYDETYGVKMLPMKSLPANKLTVPGEIINTKSTYNLGANTEPTQVAKSNTGISQLGLQAGANALDTISQAITSNQMSNLPLPNRATVRAPRFNTYVDNSKDIADIDTNVSQTMKFIKDNTSSPAVRRASMMSLLNQANKAKSSSFFNKTAMERDLENKNIQMAFDTDRSNTDTTYQNSMMQYQSNMAGLTRQSQIAANFSDKVTGLGVMKAQTEANDVGFAAILAQYPEGVRKRIMESIRQGRSKNQALQLAY